jgi:hypothetical protein
MHRTVRTRSHPRDSYRQWILSTTRRVLARSRSADYRTRCFGCRLMGRSQSPCAPLRKSAARCQGVEGYEVPGPDFGAAADTSALPLTASAMRFLVFRRLAGQAAIWQSSLSALRRLCRNVRTTRIAAVVRTEERIGEPPVSIEILVFLAFHGSYPRLNPRPSGASYGQNPTLLRGRRSSCR